MSDGSGGKKGVAAGFQKGGQYRKQVYNNSATGLEVFAVGCEALTGFTLDCGQPHLAEKHSRVIDEIINHVRVNFGKGFYSLSQ